MNIVKSGMLTAVSFSMLALGMVLPFNTVALLVLSSFLMMVTVLETGKLYGLLSFLACGVLAGLLLPDKTIAVCYIAFFGWYAIGKSYLEAMQNRALEWLLKLLLCNAAAFIVHTLSIYVLRVRFDGISWYVALIILNILFVGYDVLLSYAVGFYINRLKRMGRN